jgi:hypothetical protein
MKKLISFKKLKELCNPKKLKMCDKLWDPEDHKCIPSKCAVWQKLERNDISGASKMYSVHNY